jgi:hypothetical protein
MGSLAQMARKSRTGLENWVVRAELFSNSKGLGDLAKHLFFVDSIRNIIWIFLLFRKRIDKILHKVFLTAFQVALTLSSTLVCLMRHPSRCQD